MRKEEHKQINGLQAGIVVLSIYLLLAGVFYYASGEQLYWRTSRSEWAGIQGDLAAPELVEGFEVRQDFFL